MMEGTIVFPSILKIFEDWWNPFFPFWLAFLIATIILLIIWVFGPERGIHYVANPGVPLTMRKVKNPFTMLVDHQSTSFPGVQCTVSSQSFCYVIPFWGVPANELCEMMKMNWSSMKYSLLEDDENTFRNKCIASDSFTRLNAGEQKSLVFLPPSSVYHDERICQELFLPLVIVMVLMGDSIEDLEEPFIFVQATVIKVPAITMSVQERSHNREPNSSARVSRIPEILGIYVRESNSYTPGVVQRVYDGSLYSENVNGVEIPVCVACCQRAVNTVIFPCSHASLCSLCYHRCDHCPSCRGPMYHYFTIGPLTEIPQN